MEYKKLKENIIYFFKKKILYFKKSNKDKIIYYLENEDLFFNNGFKDSIKLEIEYDSIIELIKLCEQIDRFNKKRDINKLFKIPEKKDIYTLNLFFNYEGSFIENKKEINKILLQKILNVYEIDELLIKEQFLFFSKTIQPHIIILEKYLKVIFKNL